MRRVRAGCSRRECGALTFRSNIGQDEKEDLFIMSDVSMKVDMIGTARDVQWSPETFLGYGSIKLVAPAKVNLFLGVGERREDGYHNVVNVMHSLALHDVIYLHVGRPERGSSEAEILSAAAEGRDVDLPDYFALAGPENNLLVYIDVTDKGGVGALGVPASANIMTKAIDALARKLGHTAHEKVSIRLEKNIPHQGGLGGGSADAAAVLVGLGHFWGDQLGEGELVEVAGKLGADVAFFLTGGCAQFEGVGEKYVRALTPRKSAVVLIKPDAGVSTPAAYEAFDRDPIEVSADLLQSLADVDAAEGVPLFNNLAPVAEGICPELAQVREWAAAQEGVEDVMLCGSGATTFAIVKDFSVACRVAADAQLQGWWSRATMFSSLAAAIRPR